MLAYFAIAVAVYVLSPVTILTVIPAILHLLTASGTDYFRGSLIPVMPSTIISFSREARSGVFVDSFEIYL
jgi:hypothetical protein